MSTINLFIACSFAHLRDAHDWAFELQGHGFGITSSWHAEEYKGQHENQLSEERRLAILQQNIADLNRAHCMVVLSHLGTPRATYAEMGAAIARGLPVVFIHEGDKGRILFDSHEKVIRVDWAERKPSVDGLGWNTAPVALAIRHAVKL